MLVKCRDMQGNGLKGIIAGIILVVLCFGVGAQASEDAVSSLAVVVAFLGLFGILIFGSKSWMLLFLLPPLLELVPWPGAFAAVPMEFYAAALVLLYWLVMWGMGYVKIRWRSLAMMDIAVLLLTIVMVAAYIRRPVSVRFLGMDGDDIGGSEYVYYIMALVFYLALSVIPMPLKQLVRVLNISVVIKLCVTFILLVLTVAGVRGDGVNLAAAVSSTGERIDVIGPYATPFCVAIFSYFSLRSVLINPLLLMGAAASFAMMLITGSRKAFGMLALNVLAILAIKRELLIAVLLGGFAYMMLLVFSLGGALHDLPMSAQRICAMLPGVQVSSAARQDGDTTWEWREELWELAWDKRTGYIKDYVFGDGYGQSMAATARRYRALIRGEYAYGQDLDEFAVNGVWHHGVITAIHRIGYVGLSVLALLMAVGMFFQLRICSAWRGTPLFKPLLFYTVAVVVLPPKFVWGGADVTFHFVQFAIIKMFYCMAREEGRMKPLFQRHRYQPMMIEEHADRIQPV